MLRIEGRHLCRRNKRQNLHALAEIFREIPPNGAWVRQATGNGQTQQGHPERKRLEGFPQIEDAFVVQPGAGEEQAQRGVLPVLAWDKVTLLDSVWDIPHPLRIAAVLELEPAPRLAVGNEGVVRCENRVAIRAHVVRAVPHPVFPAENPRAALASLPAHRVDAPFFKAVHHHDVRRESLAPAPLPQEAVRKTKRSVNVDHVVVFAPPPDLASRLNGKLHRIQMLRESSPGQQIFVEEAIYRVPESAKRTRQVINNARVAALALPRGSADNQDAHGGALGFCAITK